MLLTEFDLIAIVIALGSSLAMNIILFRQLFLKDKLISFLQKRNKNLLPPF